MPEQLSAKQALAFVRKHGVVLVSARGPAPRLTEAIAGEDIKGSWWAHPRGREIFAVLQTVTDSKNVLVCRLVNGKVTLVHRRLWPALVRVAPCLPPEVTAQVQEEHTASGRHVTHEVAFPKWVPADVVKLARALGEAEAFAALGPWAAALKRPAGKT